MVWRQFGQISNLWRHLSNNHGTWNHDFVGDKKVKPKCKLSTDIPTKAIEKLLKNCHRKARPIPVANLISRPIPSSQFRRNDNFRGRAANIGSISPAKGSRRKVRPQLRFRVCDSVFFLGMIGLRVTILKCITTVSQVWNAYRWVRFVSSRNAGT